MKELVFIGSLLVLLMFFGCASSVNEVTTEPPREETAAPVEQVEQPEAIAPEKEVLPEEPKEIIEPEEEEPLQVEEESPPEEPEEPVELNCPGSLFFEGETLMDVKGSPGTIKYPFKVEMDGLNGKVTYMKEKPYKVYFGTDWLQIIMHILKDNCEGEEVANLTFKWEKGDQNKEESFTVPERGCYCLKITSDDVTIDDGKVVIDGDDKVQTVDLIAS